MAIERGTRATIIKNWIANFAGLATHEELKETEKVISSTNMGTEQRLFVGPVKLIYRVVDIFCGNCK